MQNATANYAKSSKPLARPLTVLVVATVFAIGGIAAYSFRQSAQTEAASNPETSIPAIKTVTALGRLEPSGEVVQISAPSSIQDVRLEELLVKEGDEVVQGQILAVLDSRDRNAAALKQAEERVSVAQANLNRVRAGAQTGRLKPKKQRSRASKPNAEII